MINIDKNCTGCGACYNACLQKAISMKENHEAFMYPLIVVCVTKYVI